MKKVFFGFAAALLALTACCGNKTCGTDGNCKDDDKDLVYTGILPAADTDGVRYTLTLDYDKDTKGDYDLNQTYVALDSLAPGGYKNLNSFKSEGDFYVENKTVDGQNVKYLRLVPEAKDSNGDTTTLYMLVTNDSTLTLVGADLKVPENKDLNYDLKLQK